MQFCLFGLKNDCIQVAALHITETVIDITTGAMQVFRNCYKWKQKWEPQTPSK